MPKNVPVLISSYTIKGLLEIDETDVQRRLPLSTLFSDISKDQDLFSCPPSSSLASLFLLQPLLAVASSRLLRESSSGIFGRRPCLLLKVRISLLSQIDGSPLWEILAKKAFRHSHGAVHCFRVWLQIFRNSWYKAITGLAFSISALGLSASTDKRFVSVQAHLLLRWWLYNLKSVFQCLASWGICLVGSSSCRALPDCFGALLFLPPRSSSCLLLLSFNSLVFHLVHPQCLPNSFWAAVHNAGI